MLVGRSRVRDDIALVFLGAVDRASQGRLRLGPGLERGLHPALYLVDIQLYALDVLYEPVLLEDLLVREFAHRRRVIERDVRLLADHLPRSLRLVVARHLVLREIRALRILEQEGEVCKEASLAQVDPELLEALVVRDRVGALLEEDAEQEGLNLREMEELQKAEEEVIVEKEINAGLRVLHPKELQQVHEVVVVRILGIGVEGLVGEMD